MAYTINLTNGSVLTTVADATINTTATSLTLIGRNYPRYGEIQNENFVKLLENFAGTSAPSNPIAGQLYYDSNGSINRLKVYDGARFKEVGGPIVSASEPSYANTGDFWLRSSTGQLYVKSQGTAGASAFRLIGPVADPGEGANGIIQETISDGTNNHKVISLYVNDQRVAIFNEDPEFTPTPSISGFTSIKPGVNLNTSIGAVFGGTASSALSVSAGGISGYIPSNADGSTTGTLSVANNGGLFVGSTNQFNVNVSSGNVQLRNTVNSGKIYLAATNSAGTQTNIVTVQNSTGYVGILVDPPTVPLDVNGVIRASSEIRAASNTGISVGASQQGYLSVETNNVVLRNASPNAELILRAVVGSSNTDVIVIDPDGDSGNLWTKVTSKVVPGINNAYDLGSSSLKWANVHATTFYGTSTSAQYADLAEKYLADRPYEIGIVVSVGGPAEVTACQAGDRALGVVSGSPAYMMNSELEGGTYIALKGRVPVKVVGAVKKGQRLVASDNGFAMVGSGSDVFAIALESNDDAGIKLVEAVVL
jgi:hypothetical protein